MEKKKTYIIPVASFDMLDNDQDIMTASNPEACAFYSLGSGLGEDNREDETITCGTGDALAKGSVIVEDFDYSIDM